MTRISILGITGVLYHFFPKVYRTFFQDSQIYLSALKFFTGFAIMSPKYKEAFPMNYTRILTIQDISCVGQCSMTVALPILSACGQETCILPSAVLSTHTGGFSFPAIQDLTDLFPRAMAHWQQEGIAFDAVYTGYLGSVELIERTEQIISAMVLSGGKVVVDPAMADNGKLYTGFDHAYAKAMGQLFAKADVVLPNVTEAAILTGMEYRETYDEAYILELVDRLHKLGAKNVVLTGVGYEPGQTGVLISENGVRFHYRHPRLVKSFHGTGDIYASAFMGCWMGGKSMVEAASIAADYACKCIEQTMDDDAHWYGTKFETALPWLLHRLYG